MSINLVHNVLVRIAEDASAKEKRYYPETKEVSITTAFDRYSAKNFQVAAAASEALDLSDIADVRGVYLEVDSDVDVILNGSATPIQLRVAPGATKAKMFLECIVTSLTVDNTAGAAVVNGEVVFWGDLSA